MFAESFFLVVAEEMLKVKLVIYDIDFSNGQTFRKLVFSIDLSFAETLDN